VPTSARLCRNCGAISLFGDLDAVNELIDSQEKDGEFMVCNNIVVGRKILVHDCTPQLEESLGEWEYEVMRCPADEFLKSGGSVRCLILNL
jgi:N-dimethylarginine dimethylaminohydrolase